MRIITLLAGCFLALAVRGQVADSLNQKDARGQKQGVWKKNYPNGVIRYRGQFSDNKPVGEFRYFSENGTLKAKVMHRGDGRHASTTLYDDGQRLQATGFYSNQKKDSLWVLYDINGQVVARERYREGLPHGTWETLYAGSSSLARTESWKMGIKEGLVREYFEPGGLKLEMNYAGGKAHGKVSLWYADGQPTLTGSYQMGVKDGEWLYYNAAGKLRKKETFAGGKLLKQDILIKEVAPEDTPLDPSEDPANFDSSTGY